MMIHSNRLAAKVAAQNMVNQAANDFYAAAAAALMPFVGKVILKADGTLLKKVVDALPKFKSDNQIQGSYSTGSGYSLQLWLKAHECSKGRAGLDYQVASYADAILYLGDISNGVLTRVYDAPEFKANYTEESIRAVRAEVLKAEEVVSKLKSCLYDFGMYDN